MRKIARNGSEFEAKKAMFTSFAAPVHQSFAEEDIDEQEEEQRQRREQASRAPATKPGRRMTVEEIRETMKSEL
jgi:hypothetical protein